MIIRKIFFQEKEPPINTMWVDPTGEDVKIKIYDADVEEWKAVPGTSTDPEEGITPASIGAYTKGEVDTLLATKAYVSDIPTVNDSTVTIQKNGVDVDSFTLDASTDKTIDISVPTALSELTDDSTHRLVSDSDISAWSAKQDTISDLSTIRSNASSAYQKPNTGIPKTDLASDVQTSLGKADSALQSYTESDPTVPSHVKGITTTDISNWNAKQNALTFDTTPTANSTNPVTSAGIKAYVDNATPTITMDDTPTSGSNNPVKSGGIYTALQGKEDTLTFDSTPTANSTNSVTSGGVKAALDLKANQSTTYTKTEVDALFDDVAYLGDDDGQATTLDFDPQADTVWNIPQTLGSSQQAQARANIGVVDVSGTNDGTNWTSITIGSTTKAIPSGGGGGGGETNVIESISINGNTQTVTNKNVDLPVPTSTTIETIVTLTEDQYMALATKDSSTLYIILES